MSMQDEELLRYSRQIMLPQIDVGGQQALLSAKVLIVGLGGLGSPVAMYLAGAGVGHLVLVDDDVVDFSNLQRQIIHSTEDLNQPKVESAADSLRALNPAIEITCLNARLADEQLSSTVKDVTVVVDCTDNFNTRFALNRACVEHKVPLVSGAAIRFEGQLTVFDSRRDDSPCYQCLYKEGEDGDLNCSENGVIAPLVGVIGSLQALEAIKVITGAGQPLVGRLLLFDGLSGETRQMSLNKSQSCSVCSVQVTDSHLHT